MVDGPGVTEPAGAPEPDHAPDGPSALARFRTGAVRGLGYAIARISRCHPWHPGGLDPVNPPTRKSDS